MKITAIISLLFILFFGYCSEEIEDEISVSIKYKGEFYAFLLNRIGPTGNETANLLISWGEQCKEWEEDKLVKYLGTLERLEVEGVKVLGPDYPDIGDMIVQILIGDCVVAEGVAPVGISEIMIGYDFLNDTEVVPELEDS